MVLQDFGMAKAMTKVEANTMNQPMYSNTKPDATPDDQRNETKYESVTRHSNVQETEHMTSQCGTTQWMVLTVVVRWKP